MAVYERRYRPYAGGITPEWSRFLIVPRFALRGVFRSRVFTGFFAGCFFLPVGMMLAIYLRHNLSALTLLDIPPGVLPPIDARTYLKFLLFQGVGLGFLLTILVGPGLISGDLRNHGLPLYLSRPFSRAEYLLGKCSILVLLLSAITWIPGLLLLLLQGYLEGWSWLAGHLRVASGLVLGSWIWIAVSTLLVLALSAYVKWKHLARGLFLAVILVAAGMGNVFNELAGTTWGSLLDVGAMIKTIWSALFALPGEAVLPPWAAWLDLLALCGLCLLLLARKVRAYEVVR